MQQSTREKEAQEPNESLIIQTKSRKAVKRPLSRWFRLKNGTIDGTSGQAPLRHLRMKQVKALSEMANVVSVRHREWAVLARFLAGFPMTQRRVGRKCGGGCRSYLARGRSPANRRHETAIESMPLYVCDIQRKYL